MRAVIALILCAACASAVGVEPADAALEARMLAITSELRCLVCQNQTVAESNADLAVDLRRQVRDMLRRGDDDATIRAYMTDRYGDFVLYRPPFSLRTALLWLGPALLIVVGFAALAQALCRRARAPDSAFEPDDIAARTEGAG